MTSMSRNEFDGNVRTLQWVRMLLLCILQPVFYGAATRIPLVYIGVHARLVYDQPWWKVGLLIATYQGARASINSLIPSLGNMTSHGVGTIAGLIGYALQGIFPKNLSLFWTSLLLIGHSEVIVCMQNYVKQELSSSSLASLREHLRLQYAFNVAGTALGFIVAALAYKHHGVVAVSVLGVILELLELLSLALYASLASTSSGLEQLSCSGGDDNIGSDHKDESPDAGREIDLTEYADKSHVKSIFSLLGMWYAWIDPAEDEASIIRSTIMPYSHLKAYDSTQLSCDPKSLIQTTTDGESLEKFSFAPTAASRPPWIAYLVIVTFGVQALMIGIVLSTSPIVLFQVHKVDLPLVGVIFGAGEVVGCIILFILVPFRHQRIARKAFRAPANLLLVVGGLGVLSLLYCWESSKVAIFSTVAIMTLNDVGTSLTAEIQGGSIHVAHYAHVNACANTVRRIGNTITAACGPLLYGIVFWLPFLVFASITMLWVLVMYIAFSIRAKEVMMALNRTADVLWDRTSPLSSGGIAFYNRRVTYVTAEIAMQSTGIASSNQKREPNNFNS